MSDNNNNDKGKRVMKDEDGRHNFYFWPVQAGFNNYNQKFFDIITSFGFKN